MSSLRRLVRGYQLHPGPTTAEAFLAGVRDERVGLNRVLAKWLDPGEDADGEIVAALLTAACDLTPAQLADEDLREALLDKTRRRLALWVTTERAWPYALSDPPTREEVEFVLRRRFNAPAPDGNHGAAGRQHTRGGHPDR